MSHLEIYNYYLQLIESERLIEDVTLISYLSKKDVRSLSGVLVVTVLTKPFGCPAHCVYCPTEPGMPKSYLSTEPAVARAIQNKFDTILQMNSRLGALQQIGHPIDKLEILVLGGSWSYYPLKYQEEYIRDVYYSANVFFDVDKRISFDLDTEITTNETAKCRIIGLTLETRPDMITPDELKRFRRYGCTRVQLGVQSTDNQILIDTKRGHTLETSIAATKLLKENGFKVDHHYMPDLPNSTPEKDIDMMRVAFQTPALQPDQIKIYPTAVNKHAELHEWFKTGRYVPYSPEVLFNTLIEMKKLVPPWVRINRIVRDFPSNCIIAGNRIVNLRQELGDTMAKHHEHCVCMRCREARRQLDDIANAKLTVREYDASEGKEIFISYESEDNAILYGFVRLRLNNDPTIPVFDELKNAAIIRELHVYGQLIPVDHANVSGVQHHGMGKKLMTIAEQIATDHGYNKMSVISGVGVRGYYRKLGYVLEGTYMTKKNIFFVEEI